MPNNKTKMNDIIFAILNVHNFVLKPEQINPIKEKNAINIGSKSKNSIPLADESFDKRSISLNILTEAATTPYNAYKETRKNIMAKIRLIYFFHIVSILFNLNQIKTLLCLILHKGGLKHHIHK